MPVIEYDVEVAKDKLAAAGAAVSPGRTEHERWRAQLGDATAVAYDGKVVIQGKRPHDIQAVLQKTGGRVHLYFDGASRGNPGPAAIGWVLVSSDGIIAEGSERINATTNNRAEYEALIRGLKAARNYGFETIHVRGDSELVLKQVRGEWDANEPALKERRVRVYELLESFDDWTLTHVPRELNQRADELANSAFES